MAHSVDCMSSAFFSIAFLSLFFNQSNQPLSIQGKCATQSAWQTIIQNLHFNHVFINYIQSAKWCPTTFRWFLPLLCSLCFLEKPHLKTNGAISREPRGSSHASLLPFLPPDATFTCSICGSMIALNSHLQRCHRWRAQPRWVSSTPILATLFFVC